MALFDAFDDNDHTFSRLSSTRGAYDANGVWVAPSDTSAAVSGHLSTKAMRSGALSSWNRPGAASDAMEDGDAHFFSYTRLEKGDFLTATQTSTGVVTKYRALGLVRPMVLITALLDDPTRYEHVLKEVAD